MKSSTNVLNGDTLDPIFKILIISSNNDVFLRLVSNCVLYLLEKRGVFILRINFRVYVDKLVGD